MNESNAIVLAQQPIITHALAEVGLSVTKRLEDLQVEKLIATEDNVKSLKKLAADLNAELKEFEAQRKAIKEGVMSPYNQFEAVYKSEVSTKYSDAIEVLRKKVAVVENDIKEQKRKNLQEYFESVKGSLNFLSFDRLGLEINLSTTEKKYKEQIHAAIDKVLSDLELIETQADKIEVLVEYKDTLDVNASIVKVKTRKEKEEREKASLGAAPANVVAPPQPQPQQEEPQQQPIIPQPQPTQNEEMRVARLEITGTYSQLKALSEYLKANGIIYKNL